MSLDFNAAVSALKDIDDALARVAADEQRISAERAAHATTLTAAEATERENSLPSRRGDMAAQRRLDAAVATRRDAESGIRQCDFALADLTSERQEFARQRTVAERVQLEAERAALAEQRLSLAKELDEAAADLALKMAAWKGLFQHISHITSKLGEPEGRTVPFVWEDIFSNFFHSVAPSKFDILPPSLRPVSTFTAMSRRFTPEFEQPTVGAAEPAPAEDA